MALNPADRYPAQIDADSGYPFGKARNAGSFQDGTGTPLEKDWLNDLFGLLQSLLDAAGLSPSGVPDEVGVSQYLEALRAILLSASGGTYPLESNLILQGPGAVRLNGPATVIAAVGTVTVPVGGHINLTGGPGISVKDTGRIELLDGAALDLHDGSVTSLATGAALDVTGGINVQALGKIEVQANGHITVLLNGGIDVLSGGYVHLASGAELTTRDVTQLKVTNGASVAFRLNMCGIPSDQDGWRPNEFGKWLQHDVVNAHHIMFPLNLLPGDRLDTLSVRLQGGKGGGHSTVPTAQPSVEIVSMSSNGISTLHATAFDPSGSVGAYDALHNINFLSLALLVPSDPLYARVIGEQGPGAGAVADTTELVSISGTLTPRAFRAASEIH